MKILDMFCGAGGASVGYARAFPDADITGIDINPQPDYPFVFYQQDVFDLEDPAGYDLIHASPPCQQFSTMTRNPNSHPNLIEETRDLLDGYTHVIENVRNAGLDSTLMLCGSMFGMQIQRHRYFEHNLGLIMSPPCNHTWERGRPYTLTGTGGACNTEHSLKPGPIEQWQTLMGTPWIRTKHSISEAIPPAYTKYIGRQWMASNG